MTFRAHGPILLTAGLLLGAARPAASAAQSATTSGVRGVLRADTTSIAGAMLELRRPATGVRRTAVSDEEGRFLITLLPPGGPYTLTVTSLGFREIRVDSIYLQVGETRRFALQLHPQAVEVEGLTVKVDPTRVFNPSKVGPAFRIDERTVEAMPILSRNFTDLAVLSPLVTTTKDGGFSVLGQNDRYNAILVDGLSSKDAFGLTAGGAPGGQAGARILPFDAVAQYEVLVAPYDVRLSGFTGGVMNAVTRTGTNDWRFRAFAVHRAEALMGDLELPTGPVAASGVDRSLFGLSAGGPIVRDRAHFFVSGEFERRNQPPTGYNLLRDDPALVRISPESVRTMQDALSSGFGLKAGAAGPYPLQQELTNLFGRVDWNLGRGRRVTLRYIQAGAANDHSPNRSAFEPYELSSNAVFQHSSNRSAALQYFSAVGARGGNQLDVEVHRTTDTSRPASEWPQVEVGLLSSIDGAGYQRSVRAGSQFFSQDNAVAQTSVRVTNSTTLTRKHSTYTLGLTGAYTSIADRYLPGSKGDWYFASAEDLAANAPQRFQRTVLAPGADPTVRFSIVQWGAFVQNEIDAGKGLTMRFGIRIDVPYVLGHPAENPRVREMFGRSTAHLPSGNFLISPRWGFNWQGGGRLRTQVRGGAGMFAGDIPFIWLSNAFHNNGMRSVTQMCSGRWTDEPPTGNTAPRFDPTALPTTCLLGPPTDLRTVVLFDKSFRYPQNWRFSAAVDQELSSRLSMTLGFLFNHAVHQVVLEDLNLGDADGPVGPLRGYGGLEREYFGTPSEHGFTPNREHPEFDHVLLAGNDSRDWAFSFTAELRGTLGDGLRFQTGYTFSHSYDWMSLTSTDMVSNLGLNPTSTSPNRAELRTSNFDRPHKVVAAIYGRPFSFLGDTEISLLYTGQSGLPFSYVYRGDLNGDGYPGPGGSFDRTNDLVYVPREATELPAGFATLSLLANGLEQDACLSKYRGRILWRNACRAPWQNRLDLRLAHTLHVPGADLRLEGDLINVLNLVRPGWGRIETIRPVVSLLEPVGRTCSDPTRCALVSQWAGAVLPSRTEGGKLVPLDPWSVLSPDSQWQAQFGLRVTFGAGR